MVDVGIFFKTNDYIDIAAGYTVGIKDDKLLCFFKKRYRIYQSYRTDRLEVFLDAVHNIVGFAICDLSRQERDILKSLSSDS